MDPLVAQPINSVSRDVEAASQACLQRAESVEQDSLARTLRRRNNRNPRQVASENSRSCVAIHKIIMMKSSNKENDWPCRWRHPPKIDQRIQQLWFEANDLKVYHMSIGQTHAGTPNYILFSRCDSMAHTNAIQYLQEKITWLSSDLRNG